MRVKRPALILVSAAGVALGAVAIGWKAQAGGPKTRTGTFANGMEYAVLGSGPKTLLMIPGGPGSAVPSGFEIRMMAGSIQPFLEDGFTVWDVTRRRQMPTGHTFADMADDYAQVIKDELGGKVDVVVAEESGGVIGQYLAAFHPDRLGHLALVCTAWRTTEWGKDVDRKFGEALGAGRFAEAGTALLDAVVPGDRLRWLGRLVGPVVGRWLASRDYTLPDVLIETRAELDFDGRAVLPQITVPVLLVCGDRDRSYAKDAVEETARLIPDCSLVWYEGLGHLRALSSSRVPKDVLAFVNRDRTSPAGPR